MGSRLIIPYGGGRASHPYSLKGDEKMVLPTKEQFRAYSGENIAGKLSGDIKEQERLLDILFTRCYDMIVENFIGIKEMDEDNQEDWHKLIMEQAEYLLSMGDASLMHVEYDNLSGRIWKMAKRYDLWTNVVTAKTRQPFESEL